MGESDRADKLKQLAESIDAKYSSPEERAHKVLAVLKEKYGDDLDTWDITCFAAEWLAMMSPVYTWLEEPTRSLVRLVYFAHYQRFDRELKLGNKGASGDKAGNDGRPGT